MSLFVSRFIYCNSISKRQEFLIGKNHMHWLIGNNCYNGTGAELSQAFSFATTYLMPFKMSLAVWFFDLVANYASL